MTYKNSRSEFIDITKAFAIICVIIGHCIQFGSGNNYYANGLYYENPLFIFIYSFHMPLFMLISGYLFGFSIKKRKWHESLINKTRSLLLPIFTWALIPIIIILQHCIRYPDYEIDISNLILLFFNTSFHHLWFLWAVFWCSLFVMITHFLFDDHLFIYLSCYIVMFFLPDKYNLYFYSFMFPFFVLGYLYNRNNGLHFFYSFCESKYSLLIMLVIFISLLSIYNYDSFIYTTHYSIVNNMPHQFIIDIYRFIIGLIGSITIILIFYKFSKFHNQLNGKIKQLLSWVGSETLGIYVIQEQIIRYILTSTTRNISFSYLMALTESILILIFSLFIIIIIERNSLFRLLLLGKK